MAVFILLGLLAGCATSPHPIQVTGSPLVTPADGQGWRAIRFRMDRIDGQTRWERDLLIAHKIISPLLSSHAQKIYLWRFHRRSGQDEAGHQFSFLFYCDVTEADRIDRQVMHDPLLNRLIADNLVREVRIDGVDDNARPDIEDTSDSKWSPILRAAWPYYIMGVSRMWLEIIDRISADIGVATDATLEQLIDHYAVVDGEVSQIWQQEAYHALLHHLNAIFGYRPMIYWEKRIKTF